MRLKIVIVDLELSPRAKKILIRLGLPLAVVLGGGALAYAGGWTVPNQWGPGTPAGTTLTAAALNDNFAALVDAGAALDQRVSTLEVQPAYGTFPTVTDPPSGTAVQYPSAPAIIPISTAGTYKVTVSSAVWHTAAYTNVGVYWNFGGTATRQDTLGNCFASAPAAQDASGVQSCVTVFTALAGETISVLPTYEVTYTAAGHVFAFSYLVERIGS